MKDSFILLAILTVLYATLYVVSYFPAKWMVKKRIILAKTSLIGQETPEKIELMKMVATEVLNKNTIYLEMLENEQYTVSTTVHCGEISEVKMENELVEVLVGNNGTKHVSHKAVTEESGTVVTAFYLATLLFLIFGFCILLVALLR